MDRSDKAILHKAVAFYGRSKQELKAIEELGELIRAIARARTCDDEERDTAFENLAEEMADVEIMLEQLEIIHDNQDEVAVWREIKLGRLSARMREELETCDKP